jgi:hypothetical protein
MGVRLAVSPTPPICLLRHSDSELDDVATKLCERFDPLPYHKPGYTGEKFREQFVKRLNDLEPNARTVYSSVERNLSLSDEYGGKPVYEQLFIAVNAMLGTDTANVKILYGRNSQFRRQVLQSGADSLLAALLLIDNKLSQSPLRVEDRELKEQIESLRSELLDLIENWQ